MRERIEKEIDKPYVAARLVHGVKEEIEVGTFHM